MTGGAAVDQRPDAPADPAGRRPGALARRAGYLIAAVVNAVVWYLANVHPTWHAVPFLTADTASVLPLFNLSLAATVVANLVYLAYDPRWLTAAGGVVTATIGLAVLARLLRVFPFDFSAPGPWALVVRIVLVLAIVGAVIGLLVEFGRLLGAGWRGLAGRP